MQKRFEVLDHRDVLDPCVEWLIKIAQQIITHLSGTKQINILLSLPPSVISSPPITFGIISNFGTLTQIMADASSSSVDPISTSLCVSTLPSLD